MPFGTQVEIDLGMAQRAADPSLDHETPLSEVFEDQILCADLILLSKADLAGDEGLAAAKEVIAAEMTTAIIL